MLQNAYSLAKIGADTAENERNFAEHLPKIGNYPTLKGADARLVAETAALHAAVAARLFRGPFVAGTIASCISYVPVLLSAYVSKHPLLKNY